MGGNREEGEPPATLPTNPEEQWMPFPFLAVRLSGRIKNRLRNCQAGYKRAAGPLWKALRIRLLYDKGHQHPISITMKAFIFVS